MTDNTKSWCWGYVFGSIISTVISNAVFTLVNWTRG